MRQKQVVCRYASTYFNSLLLAYNKNKLYKLLDHLFKDVFNFDFLEKSLGVAFSPHFI